MSVVESIRGRIARRASQSWVVQTLNHQGFRHLWLGQSISQLGDALYYVVFMFMVERVTGSFAMVGYVGALETLPYFLFSAHSGWATDRFDRKRILLMSDLLCGSILALFAVYVVLTPAPPFAVIGSVAFLLSTVRVFFWPAKNAAIPRLVPPESVMRANALSSMSQNVMYLTGLGLSAGVLAALYKVSPTGFFALAFGVNALSFFASAVFVAKLPPIVPERKEKGSRPLVEVREGVRYLRGRHELLVLLGLQMLLTLFISPFFPVYVATNKTWFDGLPSTLLWFEFAFFLGFVAGGAFVGKRNLTRPGLGFIWGLAAVGLTVAAMAFSPHFWLFCLWNFAAGIALPFAQIPVMTYLQVTVDDAFRGRVNSALNMMSVGIQPLGLAAAGVLLDKAGIFASFLVMGCGMAGAALLGLVDRPFRAMRLPAAPREGTVWGEIEAARGTVEAVPEAPSRDP